MNLINSLFLEPTQSISATMWFSISLFMHDFLISCVSKNKFRALYLSFLVFLSLCRIRYRGSLSVLVAYVESTFHTESPLLFELFIYHYLLLMIWTREHHLHLYLSFSRITRPWWHSLNINSDWGNFLFKDYGSIVRFVFVWIMTLFFWNPWLMSILWDIAADDGINASFVCSDKKGFRW